MLQVPSLPVKGDVLTPKVMRTVGSSTRMGGSAFGSFGIGDRLADEDVGEAGDGHDVAGVSRLHLDAIQTLVRKDVGDAAL